MIQPLSPVRAFSYHYSKPASEKAGKPQVSVHFRGKCHIVDDLVCKVPAASRMRKRQPRFVMTGRGRLTIENNIATIQ